MGLLLYPTVLSENTRYISISSNYRPVHSQLRQTFPSFLPYTFYRPPTYRIRRPPLSSFREISFLRYLSADFTELTTKRFPVNAVRSIKGGVSARYRFIPPLGFSVLLYRTVTFFYLYSAVSFQYGTCRTPELISARRALLFGVLHQTTDHLHNVGFIHNTVFVIDVIEWVIIVAMRHIYKIKYANFVPRLFEQSSA